MFPMLSCYRSQIEIKLVKILISTSFNYCSVSLIINSKALVQTYWQCNKTV